MKVVVAIDSLKGSLTSMEAGIAVKEGILAARPDAEVIVKPLADGGEGTTDALIEGMKGERVDLTVTGPMGTKVQAYYGYLEETKTAIIEMASAAGITLVPTDRQDPLAATTYGVGEMINDAIKEGAQALSKVAAISSTRTNPRLAECNFQVACDVTNPLCGKNGATYIYGPQKGVTDAQKEPLDQAMAHYAQITADTFGCSYAETEGAGAAGGLGFAFLSFLNARLTPGIDLILDAVGLEEELKNADVAVTGEGRLDHQTAMGKAPVGVARLAKKYNAKVLAFAGSVTKDAAACNQAGIDAFFPIIRGVTTLEEAMKPENARENMRASVEQVFRLL